MAWQTLDVEAVSTYMCFSTFSAFSTLAMSVRTSSSELRWLVPHVRAGLQDVSQF